MKPHPYSKKLKQTMLAVPAAAMMLGAAHAGTTIGLNVQSYYYDSGTTPQSVGFGAVYQLTGFPVTAKAFGVSVPNWVNTPIYPIGHGSTVLPVDDVVPLIGSVTAHLQAANVWESGLLDAGVPYDPSTTVVMQQPTSYWPVPGDYEVVWSWMDNTGWSLDLTNLSSQFPKGYVLGLISGKLTSTSTVTITEDTASAKVGSVTYSLFNPQSDGIGFGVSTALTNDAITLSNPSHADTTSGSSNCTLAGLIITDVPVVGHISPKSILGLTGDSITLSSTALGIGTLSYQWQHGGTNIPGATFANYTNNNAAASDSGSYQVVVSSTAFPSSPVTSDSVTVSIFPPKTVTFDANTSVAGAQDGSGSWDSTLTNFWNGTNDEPWVTLETAVFGAGTPGAYTVALTTNIIANAITFNTATYTITNTSTETLTLRAATTITANSDAIIEAPLVVTGTNSLVKAGTGTLTISNGFSTTATNLTYVSAGTLEVYSKGSDSPYVVTNGATLKLGYSTGGGYANTGLTNYGAGTAATTGLYLMGGTTYNVSGTLSLVGAPTTIRQYGDGFASLGIFDINSIGLYCTAAASGSIIDSNIQFLNDGYGMALQVDAGANTATGDLIVNGPLNVSSKNGIYGLFKRGTGSLILNASALSDNCGLNVLAGKVVAGAVDCVGGGALLQTGVNSTFDMNGYSQTVNSVNLAGALKMSINRAATPNATTLTVQDGSAPLNYGGSLTVSNTGGTLSLGDSFTLFSCGGGYSGYFTNGLVLPSLPAGLVWSNGLATNGTITVVVPLAPPSFIVDLPGTTNYAYLGSTVTYSIVATGDGVLNYAWNKNGTTPIGTNSPSVVVGPVTAASAGYYYCTVTNQYGRATTQTNYLQVITPSGFDGIIEAAGPIDYWPLNENYGTNVAVDQAGTNNATYGGNFNLNQTGPFLNTLGVSLDGSSGTYVAAAYSPSLNPAVFSAEAWVNPSGANTGSTLTCALSCGQFGNPRSGWLIYQAAGSWNLRTYYGGGTATAANVSGVTAPAVGTWSHLLVTWDGHTASLYVNGVLEGSQVPTTTPNYLPGASGGFAVGARAGSSFWWNGQASEVALYNRVLTPNEIKAHASNRPIIAQSVSGANLILTWPAGTGSLQSAPEAKGPYTTIPSATSPYTVAPSGARKFFRLSN